MSASRASRAQPGRPQNWAPLLEQAVREVFERMMGCTLAVPPTPAEATAGIKITSMVGLAGELCGLLSIKCSTAAATLMASKMLAVQPNQVGTDMCDALGEVGNMVAGNFKNKIPGLGDRCMLSVPTVITGADYNLRSNGASPAVELRLLFESMPIVIALQVSE